jgi:N-acetylmuramoyl-L-alanine amidase
VSLAVIHCTELPDLATARDYGQRIQYPESGTGNAGHFYVDRNGNIEQWVPLDRVAHHVRGSNDHSVGIELVNSGRFPDWYDSRNQGMTEPYPAPQISSLVRLLSYLCLELENLEWIAGHEDLDLEQVPASDNPQCHVQRKKDPGPHFPWAKVLAEIPLQRMPSHATPESG